MKVLIYEKRVQGQVRAFNKYAFQRRSISLSEPSTLIIEKFSFRELR